MVIGPALKHQLPSFDGNCVKKHQLYLIRTNKATNLNEYLHYYTTPRLLAPLYREQHLRLLFPGLYFLFPEPIPDYPPKTV